MKFKQLTERDRYIIEYMLSDKKSVKEIAEELGKSYSSIYREIKRGTVTLRNSDLVEYQKYCADAGQRVHDERKHFKGAPLKIGNDLEYLRFIEDKIVNDGYSPQAVLYYIRNHGLQFRTTLCKGTIYSYIEKGIFLNLTNKNLSVKRTKKQKHEVTRVTTKTIRGKSIEERAKSIMKRADFGHWEMDTVYSGKGQGKACLLVLSERMLRLERIIKIPDRTSVSVVRALNRLERVMGFEKFRSTFKTITCDNGMEFIDFKGIEQSFCRKNRKRTELYYCHPYCSSERGTNENINRMIRRKISKGDSIAKYSNKEIQSIEDWINEYPRRIFGGLSSNEVYAGLMNAIPQ